LADVLPALDRLATDGIISRNGGLVEVKAEARSLVRLVASTFDAYLDQTTRAHSQML
jgi:oxygen-independent coproporphyrinogen-3 oxidase